MNALVLISEFTYIFLLSKVIFKKICKFFKVRRRGETESHVIVDKVANYAPADDGFYGSDIPAAIIENIL